MGLTAISEWATPPMVWPSLRIVPVSRSRDPDLRATQSLESFTARQNTLGSKAISKEKVGPADSW
jgi:hypothetical protein